MSLLGGAARLPGILGTVFGGQNDPRLSPEQNEQQRRQAILMAGLGILGSGETGLRAIAQGAMYGQQAGMQGRQNVLAQQQATASQDALRGAVKDGQIDRSALERLFVAAIQSGDMEAAGKLSEVLKSMGGQQQSNLPSWQSKEGVNPATGKPEQYQINPQTGEIRWLGIPPIVSATNTSSDIEQQRRFQRENALVDDFNTQVKPFKDTYQQIAGTLASVPLAKAGDGAAQNELVVTFVKALDPTSVAREGEVELARSAASIWDQVQAGYKKYISGDAVLLPPELINKMEAMLKRRAANYEKQWSGLRENYTARAKRWGVDPEVFMAPPKLEAPKAAGAFDHLIPAGK